MLNLKFDYDKDSDVLYISVGQPRPSYGLEEVEGIIIRRDFKTHELTGVTILHLSKSNRQAVARDLFLKTVAGFGLTTLNAYCTPAMVVETAGIYTKIYCYELSLFGKYKVDMDLLDIVLMLAHLQALQYSIFNDNVDVDALEDMLDKFFDNIVWGKCVE